MITTPAVAPKNRSLLKKQFPTLLGLLVLIAGLAIGGFVFSGGTGIFLPRATPETTPKSIRLSNLTDQGFSITFMTDEATSGFIRYGTDPKKLTQIGDQRDQLTGSVGEYTLHQISILRGLEPDTTYYYVLGTGSGSLFDDNGEPFTIKTARQAGTQPKALTVFGSAVNAAGSPAAGAVVFVTPPNAGTLSSLVTTTGSWAVSLSTARMKDGSGYAPVAVGDELAIQVMAVNPSDNTQLNAKVEAETSIAIKLGSTATDPGESAAADDAVVEPAAEESTASGTTTVRKAGGLLSDLVDSESQTDPADSSTASATNGTLGSSEETAPSTASATTSTPAVTSIDLSAVTPTEKITVTTGQPTITGTVKPNVTVNIEVHSDNQIQTQVVSDENGEFTVDIEALKATLEPGEHTITYSYVDPDTGKTVTKTQTFTVEPKVMLAATTTATPTPTPRATPFSSTNPYPIGTSSATGTTSATPRPTTRSANLSTGSGLPTSGSVGTTFLLIGGGMFFLISGLWSWWISRELAEEYTS